MAFQKFIYDYFFINLKNYPNINIDFEINVFLLIFTVALSVSIFVVNIYRGTMQNIVLQLTRHEAIGSGAAKTLKSLGLDNGFFLRHILSGEGELAKVVGRVGEITYTYEEYVELSKKGKLEKEKIDFDTAEFYIRNGEGALDRANFIINNYGTSLFRSILYCVLFFALYVCIALAMPEILSIIDGVFGSMVK